MATTVDTLLVRIEADMTDLSRSLKKVQRDVDKSSRGISGAMKKIGGAMKITLAAVALRQGFIAGKAMVDLASDIQEMEGKSKVVFGKFRDVTVEALEEFGDQVGRSTHELEGMAASIQDTFVPMGFARGEAAKLSVELTKLAVDVASFNNASDTETMAAFQSALVGNHETVRRYGVIITETTLNQELMRMGVEKGTKAATEAEKVQARLNLITSGTSDAAGDAARTSDSYANTLRGLKAAFSELAGELGEIFLPAITRVLAALKSGAEQTKDFLRSIGILKMPIVDQFAKLTAEIEVATKRADGASKSLEDALTAANEPNADQFAGYAVKGATVAATLATDALKELMAQHKIVAEEFAMNVPIPESNQVFSSATSGTSTSGAPLTADAQKQLAAFNAMVEQRKISLRLENELSVARLRNDDDAIRSAMAAIEAHKLKSKFDKVDEVLRIKLGKEIALNALAEEKRAAGIKAAREAQDKANATAESGLAYVRENIDLTYGLEQVQHDLNAAKRAGLITDEEYLESMDQIAQKIKELDPIYKQMADRANAAFESTADALTQMVMDGKLNLKTLGDIFKSTLNDMIADALKAQVIRPLLSSIFGGIGGAIGGPVGAFISGVGQKAGGGRANGPTLVGERGPELIVPSGASRVMNNHDTKNAMGGGSATVVNQTINVNAGVSQTVRAEMISLLPRFKQETLSSVLDAKRRGGSFGNAFA